MNASTNVVLAPSTDVEAFDLGRQERESLARLGLVQRLQALTSDRRGLARFAEAFFFVRVGFVRHNFLLGARCPPNEALWGPIARNLWEELGSGGTAHNELYRRFLRDAGRSERDLSAPDFAKVFDGTWETFVTTAPLAEALIALALYESLDGPDYSALLEALQPWSAGKIDLEFFEIHAEARHLDLFADMDVGLSRADMISAIDRASRFVSTTQERMWVGLLDHLAAS